MADEADIGAPLAGVNDDGNMIIMTSRGAAATCIGGEWRPGLGFSARVIENFEAVTDVETINTVMAQAAWTLRQSLIPKEPG